MINENIITHFSFYLNGLTKVGENVTGVVRSYEVKLANSVVPTNRYSYSYCLHNTGVKLYHLRGGHGGLR